MFPHLHTQRVQIFRPESQGQARPGQAGRAGHSAGHSPEPPPPPYWPRSRALCCPAVVAVASVLAGRTALCGAGCPVRSECRARSVQLRSMLCGSGHGDNDCLLSVCACEQQRATGLAGPGRLGCAPPCSALLFWLALPGLAWPRPCGGRLSHSHTEGHRGRKGEGGSGGGETLYYYCVGRPPSRKATTPLLVMCDCVCAWGGGSQSGATGWVRLGRRPRKGRGGGCDCCCCQSACVPAHSIPPPFLPRRHQPPPFPPLATIRTLDCRLLLDVAAFACIDII